jgi:hypothetical protein
VQHFIEGADRIGIDGIEQESSFSELAAGRRKTLSAARLETPMMTKTTSSKPAGSIFAARETTRASNGPNSPGRSSQPRLLSMDFAW